MAIDNEDLEINIGGNAEGTVEASRAAQAAINKVQREASALDRAFRSLRGSLDPMYAAQSRYNDSLAQANTLLQAGRISEAEYAASVDAATQALARQSAAQLKGTEVAKTAAAETRAAARAKAAEEASSGNLSIASAKAATTSKAAEEARLTALAALEAKNRAAIALKESKDKVRAARDAEEELANTPRPRNAQGRFVSPQVVAAERAAATAEAEEQLRLAQLDSVAANQKARNAERVANTREETARRAVIAEEQAAIAARTAAQVSAEAHAVAAQAAEALAAAEEVAAGAAIKSAEEQAAAAAELAAATEAKAKAAADAAAAEEAEAQATRDAEAADRKATAEKLRLEAATRRAAAAEASRVSSANRIKAALDPAYAAQLKYNNAISTAANLASTGHIDEATRVREVARAEQELSKALKEGAGHAVNNRAAYEGLVLVHEALEHRFTRAAGSAMIFGQALIGEGTSAGLLAVAMSPVGLAITAVVVSMTALTFAAAQGSIQQAHLQQALAVTGNFAGLTAGQIDAAAQKIASSTHTGIGQAEASLQQLTISGRVSGQTLTTMGEIVGRLSELTHEKASVITNDMIKMADEPLQAMKKLQDQYHFLTPVQEEHIRNLVEEGNKTQAVAELADAFNSALKSEEVHLTGFAGVLRDASNALGNFWQGMMNIGKAPDAASHLAKLNAEIASTQRLIASGDHGADLTQRLVAFQKEAAQVKAGLDADATKAHKAQLIKQADDDRDALNALETSTRTNHEKMLREQAAWRKESKSLLANPEASPEDKRDAAYRLAHPEITDAAIAKRYDKADQPKNTGPGQVSVWAEQLHQKEILSKDFFKDQTEDELAFWSTKLTQTKQGTKEWIEVNSKIYELQKKLAKSAYEDVIAALKEKTVAAKGDLLGEELAWASYLVKVKSVMGETSKEYKDAEKDYIEAQHRMAEARAKRIGEEEKQGEQPAVREHEIRQTTFKSEESSIGFKQQGGLSATKAAEEKRAVLAQEIAEEQAFEDRIYEMKLQALQKELALPNLAKDKAAEIQEQIQTLEQSHQDKLQQIRDKSLLDWQTANQNVAGAVMAKWKTVTDAMTNTLASSTERWIEHGITFRQFMVNIAESLINTWVTMGFRMLNSWILSMVQQKVVTQTTTALQTGTVVAGQTAQTSAVVAGQTAQTTATVAGATTRRTVNALTALKEIAGHAATAAAGAYSALAGIPIIGPVLGAAAAVATFAAVIAFGGLVSAAGGYGEVPRDGTGAILHAKEMVLPAKYAVPLRQMLVGNSDHVIGAAKSSGESARETASAGGPTFNYQPNHTNLGGGFENLLRSDASTLRRWVKNEWRRGNFK